MAKEWPPEMLALPDRKCKKCGVTKKITEFPRNRTSPGGVFETCMVCYKASRGTRSKQETDTRFTGQSEYVRATPTFSRTQPAEKVVLPEGVEHVQLKRLNQLPKTLCIERDDHQIMSMLRQLDHMKQKVKIIYSFKNRLNTRYYIFLVPEGDK